MSVRIDRPSRRPRRLLVAPALLVTVIAIASACDPLIGTTSGPLRRATLTSASGMTYHYTGNRSVVFAQPGTPSSDTNVREVSWYPDSAFTADQRVCETWNTVATPNPLGLLQPGVSLRVAPVTGDGRGVRAITVTQNIVFGAIWLFNVHVWNSLDTANPFTLVGQFDLSGTVGSLPRTGFPNVRMVPAPWHICAQVTGSVLTFFVWTGPATQPSTADASHVESVTLPAGWDYPGYAGGYMGHLRPGQAAAFSNVTTGPPG